MGSRKAAIPVFVAVFLIGLALALALLALGELNPAGKLARAGSGLASVTTSHGGSTGSPGFPAGGPNCERIGQEFYCTDSNGNRVGYHCGDVFQTDEKSEDTHANWACDVESFHCPAALGGARASAATACPFDCPEFVETGTITFGFCYTLGEGLETNCGARVYGKCETVSE